MRYFACSLMQSPYSSTRKIVESVARRSRSSSSADLESSRHTTALSYLISIYLQASSSSQSSCKYSFTSLWDDKIPEKTGGWLERVPAERRRREFCLMRTPKSDRPVLVLRRILRRTTTPSCQHRMSSLTYVSSSTLQVQIQGILRYHHRWKGRRTYRHGVSCFLMRLFCWRKKGLSIATTTKSFSFCRRMTCRPGRCYVSEMNPALLLHVGWSM